MILIHSFKNRSYARNKKHKPDTKTETSCKTAKVKNKLIGLLIIALYLSNKYICDFFYSDNIEKLWLLYACVLSGCMLLAIKYKSDGNFIEKLFISMVLNNIYVILFKNETTYTLNDLWMIGLFFAVQYIGKLKKDE